MAEYSAEYLQHFGVLGMHWGSRKAEPVGTGQTRGGSPASGVRSGLSDAGNNVATFARDHKKGIAIALGVGLAGAAVAAGGYKFRRYLTPANTKVVMSALGSNAKSYRSLFEQHAANGADTARRLALRGAITGRSAAADIRGGGLSRMARTAALRTGMGARDVAGRIPNAAGDAASGMSRFGRSAAIRTGMTARAAVEAGAGRARGARDAAVRVGSSAPLRAAMIGRSAAADARKVGQGVVGRVGRRLGDGAMRTGKATQTFVAGPGGVSRRVRYVR